MNIEIMRFGNKERAVCSSLDVAETFGKKHRHIMRDIRNLDCSEEFGKSNFGLTSYTDEQGKIRPMVVMTRDGFVFLVMGYRGEKAARFKETYIKRFNQMEKEINRKLIEREALKPVRRSMTDAIQAIGGDKWSYKHYTDLAYKSVTGKNAAQLRKERGADKKAVAVDYMTADEIQKITRRQEQFTVLMEIGLDYQQIKAIALKQVMPVPVR